MHTVLQGERIVKFSGTAVRVTRLTSTGRLVLPMVSVNRPHVPLHQRVAAELDEDVVARGRVRESFELLARTRSRWTATVKSWLELQHAAQPTCARLHVTDK